MWSFGDRPHRSGGGGGGGGRIGPWLWQRRWGGGVGGECGHERIDHGCGGGGVGGWVLAARTVNWGWGGGVGRGVLVLAELTMTVCGWVLEGWHKRTARWVLEGCTLGVGGLHVGCWRVARWVLEGCTLGERHASSTLNPTGTREQQYVF